MPTQNYSLSSPEDRLESFMTAAPLSSSAERAGLEVRAITVASINGSASYGHRSGGLGNDFDRKLLARLRQWADCIVVGAATVRAENYGPVQPSASGTAPLAIICRRLDFERSDGQPVRLWQSPSPGHFYLMPAATSAPDPASDAAAATALAHGTIIPTGGGHPSDILNALYARGFRRIALEGGPSILGDFLAEDLVDRLFFTLSPLIASHTETPVTSRTQEDTHHTLSPHWRRLALEAMVVDEDSTVFLRYRRANSA